MAKIISSILLGTFFLALCGTASAEEVKIVASQLSDRYHLSTCKIAKKIDPRDLIVFKTPEEAVAAGLNPCKKCNPPTSSVKSG